MSVAESWLTVICYMALTAGIIYCIYLHNQGDTIMGYYRSRRHEHYYDPIEGELRGEILGWCIDNGVDRKYVDRLNDKAEYDYDLGAKFTASTLPSAMKEYMKQIKAEDAENNKQA